MTSGWTVCRRAAAVDQQHVLEEAGDLLDQVRREDDGARVLGVVGEQSVVEQLPGAGVQPQVGLVEQGDGRPRRQADDDADGGGHAAGELLDRPPRRQVEVGHQRSGEVGVPAGEQHRGRRQRVLHAEVVGVALPLLDEADVPQHRVVLVRHGTEHLHPAARGHAVAGQQLHQRRLAGPVASEQAGDHVLAERRRDAVQCGGVPEPHRDVLQRCGGGHRPPSQSSIIAASSRTVMPSFWASVIRGRTY